MVPVQTVCFSLSRSYKPTAQQESGSLKSFLKCRLHAHQNVFVAPDRRHIFPTRLSDVKAFYIPSVTFDFIREKCNNDKKDLHVANLVKWVVGSEQRCKYQVKLERHEPSDPQTNMNPQRNSVSYSMSTRTK